MNPWTPEATSALWNIFTAQAHKENVHDLSRAHAHTKIFRTDVHHAKPCQAKGHGSQCENSTRRGRHAPAVIRLRQLCDG